MLSLKFGPPITFSWIPSSPATLVPRRHVMVRMASGPLSCFSPSDNGVERVRREPSFSSPPDGIRCTFSTATPPSKPGGKPVPARPKDFQLISSSALHVPLAKTAPLAFLCTKVPPPDASSSPGVNLPDPAIVTTSPLLALARSGQNDGDRVQRALPPPAKYWRVACSLFARAAFAKVRLTRMMPTTSALILRADFSRDGTLYTRNMSVCTCELF